MTITTTRLTRLERRLRRRWAAIDAAMATGSYASIRRAEDMWRIDYALWCVLRAAEVRAEVARAMEMEECGA